MLIIGDIHGKIHSYYELVKDYPGPTFQVGDFGFEESWRFTDQLSELHKVGQGNHDCHDTLHYHRAFVGRFGEITHGVDFFWIGGELSIDMVYRVGDWMSDRTKPCTWWVEEELDYEEMRECERQYLAARPRIVMAHSCPASISNMFMGNKSGSILDRYGWGHRFKSRTQRFLQTLWDQHKPKLWVFGHFHTSQNFVYDGTRFVCLEELGTFELS